MTVHELHCLRKINNMITSKELANQNELLAWTPQGIVTLQELLQREQGRKVQVDEAVEYVRKTQFINNLIRLSHKTT